VVILAQKGKILDHELGDSGAILGTAPNTMGFVAMSTLDGRRSTSFEELPTPTPQIPKPGTLPSNPSAEKKPVEKPQKPDEPVDNQDNQRREAGPLPDYMRDPISPQRPEPHFNNSLPNSSQSNSSQPKPTEVQEGRFFDPNRIQPQANSASESNVSRDSWRQSGAEEADTRSVAQSPSSKGSCQ
jgi:hypothetical protein